MCRAGTTAGPELGHGAPAASTHLEYSVTRCARVNLPIDVTLNSRYFLHAIHQGPDYRERAAAYEPVEQLLEAYAKLIVRVGVNVQFGQRVVVRCAIEHAAVARAVATQAYRAGASHVRSTISIRCSNGPVREIMSMLGTDHVAWTVAGAPNPAWAESIFGIPDVDRLWRAIAVATRLDERDPVGAWRAHLARLAVRRDLLNVRAFDRIRFRGPGTNLTVGLSPFSRWVTAAHTNADGTEFVANLPTEEVYTAPDCRVPTVTFGPQRLSFSPRRIHWSRARSSSSGTGASGLRARRGEAAVHQQFDAIPRARHLGEVAIVDSDSRVRRTSLTFDDMPYDENVGSHVVWGMGFPTTCWDRSWPRGTSTTVLHSTLTSASRAGLNQSGTHVDAVVGSPDVEIDGLEPSGHVVPITRGDTFVLDSG